MTSMLNTKAQKIATETSALHEVNRSFYLKCVLGTDDGVITNLDNKERFP
jgi:hypothetical protein